jgi:hypothetical protein
LLFNPPARLEWVFLLEAIMAGNSEGDACGRNGCAGVIDYHPAENCSCHLSAPCSQCTSPRHFCPECDWQESKDPTPVPPVYTGPIWKPPAPAPLDATKIDWRNFPHSGCSMVKEGVYPEGTPIADVRKAIDGTFGGRFEKFGGGKFKFIAYTD